MNDVSRRDFLRGLWGVACTGSVAILTASCAGGIPSLTRSAQPGVGDATDTSRPRPVDASPRRGGLLKVALSSDVVGLDPHGASSGIDANLYTSIYNGLVTPNDKLEIVPDLAQSWSAPDEKTYVFKLRPGLKFHDGTPCDADAVKQSFDWILDPANASPRRPEIAVVKAVSVGDPLTVQIALESPAAPFMAIIADRAGYIVSPSARQKFGKDYARNPVGTGPFQFVEWLKDDHITLKRNDAYFENGLPLLDQIVYRAIPDLAVALTELKTGGVDFLSQIDPKDVNDIKSAQNLTYREAPGLGFQGLWFNTGRGPFANKALRQAASVAIDREALLQGLYFGVGSIATGPIAPGSWAFDAGSSYPRRDLAVAKAKLTEGGEPGGFSMVLKGGATNPVQQKLMQIVQDELKDVSINVQLQSLDLGAILKAAEQGDFDALTLGWSGYIDPDQNIAPLFQSNGAFNYGKYMSVDVDQLLAHARETSDLAERKKTYLALQNKLNDDVPYAFTYVRPTSFATGEAVKGFELTPDGLMRFKSTWVDR